VKKRGKRTVRWIEGGERERGVDYYNEFYVHSALVYLSPIEFSQLWDEEHSFPSSSEIRIS